MRRTALPIMVIGAAALAAPLIVPASSAVAQTTGTCAAPTQGLTFEMDYIDTSRAGGEPIIELHPDGQLLWGSHAGTTHFYSPEAPAVGTAAFVENYEGQTYYYVSEDGDSWDFVPRTPVSAAAPVLGVPATGFSDPEFAIESDGTVYVSEINLANIAIYRSEDGGRTYEIRNVFSFTSSDRQWTAADGEGEMYMTANGFGGGSFPASPVGNLGHFMAKSTDGGMTFGAASTTNTNGIGDIQIDHDRGILYELSVTAGDDGTVSMARFPNIRNEDSDFTTEINTIAENVGLSGVQRLIDTTFDMDEDGNLYVVWGDNGSLGNPQGIYFSSSTDQGVTWSPGVRVDGDEFDKVWPWITVGAPGNVAITWLQSDQMTDDILAGEAGGTTALWDVMVAHTNTGLGCAGDSGAGFLTSKASSEPIHTGTICQHGTTCQADLTDRRLGDYFTIVVGGDDMLDIAVSDTRQGGAVSLPLHIRQTGGPGFGAATAPTNPAPSTPSSSPAPASPAPSSPTPAPVTASPTPAPAAPSSPTGGSGLPSTGGGAVLAAALLLAGATALQRRHQPRW